MYRPHSAWPSASASARHEYYRKQVDDDPFSFFVTDPSNDHDNVPATIAKRPRPRSSSPGSLSATALKLRRWFDRADWLHHCQHDAATPSSAPPVHQVVVIQSSPPPPSSRQPVVDHIDAPDSSSSSVDPFSDEEFWLFASLPARRGRTKYRAGSGKREMPPFPRDKDQHRPTSGNSEVPRMSNLRRHPRVWREPGADIFPILEE